jgi:O-antigen ligase
MPPTADPRWAAGLDRLAALLALTAAALRLGLSGASAGTGMNSFAHLLPWLALAAWFATRAFSGGGTWRVSGFEFAVLGLAVAELLSTAFAGYKLPALEQSFAHLSFGLFLLLAVQVLGRDGLLAALGPALPALAAFALVQYFVVFPELIRRADAGGFGNVGEELSRRIGTREVFASFLGPNQFAGFLALTLPIALGRFLDARPLGWEGLGPIAIGLALGAVAIVLTGSLGGWVALAAGLAAFAGLALTRERGRRPLVVAGAAAAALGVALALFTPLLEKVGERSHSIHVRRAYWTAAARLAAERPLLGVGPGNYQDEATRVKPETQQEAAQVHNDYLGTLAESGLLGLLAVAGLLGLGLRRGLAAEGAPGPDAPPMPRWIPPVAALLGFALLALRGSFDLAVVAAGLVWFAFACIPATPAGAFTRLGAAAGLLALLVHMSVEFLFVEHGVAFALFAVLALLELLREKPAAVVLSRPACAGATALLLALVLPGLWVTGRALAADRSLLAARDAFLMKGMEPQTLILAESARDYNPWNPESRVLFASALLRLPGAGPERPDTAAAAIESAVLLRPAHSPYRAYLAQLHLFARRRLEGAPDAVSRAAAGEHLRRALEAQEKATSLYPTRAGNRYALARILDLAGEASRAESEFREALRYSDLASKELENLGRLQLAPIERLRALARTGRADEARSIATALIGTDPADPKGHLEAVRRRPELLPVPDDEIDAVTRPVIEAAIDEALKRLR